MSERQWATRHYTGAQGLRIVADVGGDRAAPAVVLMHGGGQTRHSWDGTMRELVDAGYHVVNVDARGHGESAWSPSHDYSIDALAGDLACVAQTLPSRPALVGASMGGVAALYLAGMQDVASALVMVDIVPRMGLAAASRILDFMRSHSEGFSTLDDAVRAVAAYNPARQQPADAAGLMKNLRERNGRLYWHWDPHILGFGHEQPPLEQRLNRAAENVTIPTLLVRGLRSNIVTDDGVADFKARIQHLEVLNVDGAGHMVVGDRNDVFSQGIMDFLRRLPPSEGLGASA